MKQIKATIVFPVEVSIQVPEKSNQDFVWESLMQGADKELQHLVNGRSEVAPVIHSCTDSSMVNHGIKKADLKPDTQAEYVQAAIQGLINAEKNIRSATIVRPFLLNFKTKDGQLLVDKIAKLAALAKEVASEVIAATNPIKNA